MYDCFGVCTILDLFGAVLHLHVVDLHLVHVLLIFAKNNELLSINTCIQIIILIVKMSR